MTRTRICAYCESEFSYEIARGNDRLYCTKACSKVGAKATQKRLYAARRAKAVCVRCGKGERLGAMSFCAPCYVETKQKWIAWVSDRPHAKGSHARHVRMEAEAEGFYTAQDLLDRVALFDNRCAWCGTEKWKTFDHVEPLGQGGTNWPTNLVPACTPCNKAKRDKRPALYAQERLTSGLPVTAFVVSLLGESNRASVVKYVSDQEVRS